MASFRFRHRSNCSDVTPSGSNSGGGCAGRTIGVLFGLVFFGFGAFFLVLIVREAWSNWQTRSWTAVPCTILESTVRQDDDNRKPYRPYVRYRFQHAGEEREDDRRTRKDPGFDDYGKAQAVADRFPVGSTATAYLYHADPGRAVLEHKSAWIILAAVLPLIFMTIGLAVVVGVWKGSDAKAGANEGAASEEQGAISEKPRLGRGVGIAFFALFFIIGLAVFIPVAIVPALRLASAQNWPAVECTIVSSRVREKRGDDNSTYRPDILYRYTFNGREYRSSRHSPYKLHGVKRASAAEVVRQYRAGRAATCYVNPANPAEA
ncbi:MAG: DUF3592 domain-containing protein, partial [Tepidisphaeraceae bacterium]